MELLNPLSSVMFPARSAAYTATAGVTASWNPGPQGVTVWSDQACYVVVGEGVTATVNDTPVPPFTMIPFKVPVGTGAPWAVSAVWLGVAGTIYAKPINAQ